MSRWGFAACFAGAPQRAGNVRERGASRAAGVAQGGGDGMHACMGRVRRACTCPARDVGHARGRGALGGGAFAPPRQLGRGGELSTTTCRKPHLEGRSEAARFMPNEEPPPDLRAAAKKSARQSLKPVQNDATTVMPGVGHCERTCRALRFSSCMVHQGASTRRAPLPDTPTKFPETFHAPGDTRGHGRWITITGARQRNRLRTMRQGRAVQAPSRSRTHGAKGRTSQM